MGARVPKEYKKIITQFLWNGKKPKIAYTSLTQTISRGGLNLIDLDTRIKVNHLQWIRRMIARPEMNTAVSLSSILGSPSLVRFFRGKDPTHYKNQQLNRFYLTMLLVWSPLRCFEPVGEREARREPLWDNRLISWNIPIYKRRAWEEAGILFLQDICKEGEGRLLSCQELKEKFNVNASFLDILGLRLAIPWNWKRLLSPDWQDMPQTNQDLYIKFGNGESSKLANLLPKNAYKE